MKIKQLLYIMNWLLINNVFALFSNNFIIAGEPQTPKNNVIEVYGHRGARSFAPENSIIGYKTALGIGVNWVDMDVGVTKDGDVIVYHDMWINSDFTSKDEIFLANSNQEFINKMGINKNQLIKPYLLKNLTFKQLQSYDVGILNPNSSYKNYFENQYIVPGTKIPLLQDVINYVDKISNKEVMYQIEIKNDPNNPDYTISSTKFAKKIYNILRKNNLINRAEIQAFDWNILYEIQKLDKNIKTAYLISYDEIDYNDLSNFKSKGTWSGGKMLHDYNKSLPQMIKSLGGCCYEPEDIMLTKKDLDEAHKLGLKVVVWTWPEHSGKAFDPVLIDNLISWGVDGIITDDPARLNSMLAARGYKTPKNYSVNQ